MRMLQSQVPDRRSFRKQEGQVLVEYLLMLSLAVALLVTVQLSFKRSVFSIWKKFSAEVSAACPKGCLPDGRIR